MSIKLKWFAFIIRVERINGSFADVGGMASSENMDSAVNAGFEQVQGGLPVADYATILSIRCIACREVAATQFGFGLN